MQVIFLNKPSHNDFSIIKKNIYDNELDGDDDDDDDE